MSRKAELLKSIFVLAVGKLSAQALTFLLIPAYTLFLSVGEFGTLDLIVTYMMLSSLLFSLQLERGVFRYLIDRRGDRKGITEIFSNSLVITLPVILVFSLLAVITGIFVDIYYMPLVVLATILLILSSLVLQAARGIGDNKLFALSSVIGSVIMFGVTLALLRFTDLGIASALAGYIISSLCSLFYTSFRLKAWKYVRLGSVNLDTIRDLISFSGPLVPSALSWWAIKSADRTIIALFVGLPAVGLYAASLKYTLVFMALYSVFEMAWTESAVKYIEKNNRDQFFSKVYNSSVKIFGSTAVLIVAITPFVFGLIIGEDFREAYNYVPLLVLVILANIAVSMLSVVYIAKKMTKKVLTTSVLAAALSIGLSIALIGWLGVYAVMIASLVAFASMAVYRYFDIKKYVDIRLEKEPLLQILALFIIASIAYFYGSLVMQSASLVLCLVVMLLSMRRDIIEAYKMINSKFINILS